MAMIAQIRLPVVPPTGPPAPPSEKPALPQVVGPFPGDRPLSAAVSLGAWPASLSAPAQDPVELGDGQGRLGVAWVAWTKSVQSELEKTQ